MADNPQLEQEIANDTGTPLPVSVSALPLPSGASTSALQTTGNTSLASIDTKLTSPITVQGTVTGVPQRTLPLAPVSSNSYPNPLSAYPDPNITANKFDYNLTLDVFDNLQVRGPAITDEGSFRDDFSGSSLYVALTGTMKFLNSSTAVTSVGGSTLFTSQVNSGFYIKATSDAESALTQIAYVQDDGNLFLTANYGSNNNNTAAHVSRYRIVTAATGGTTSVANSLLSLSSGTANAGISSIQNTGDYLPYVFECQCAITQRIANNSTILGFSDNPLSSARQALVKFDGTDNTKVKFITSSSPAAADTETTTVTLPNGATTDQQNVYEIDLSSDAAVLIINGIVDKTNGIHSKHIPGPYDVLTICAAMVNAAVVTATTLNIDWILWNNLDRLNITNDMAGQPTAVYGTVSSVPVDGQKFTFSASISGLAVAASATDVFTITGSATKTVKVTHLEVSAVQTTSANAGIVLLKRSTANSGGTSTNPAKVPHDSNNPAATATVAAYTANPTTGSLVGNIRANKIFVSTAGSLGQEVIMDFGQRPGGQALTLRGAAESLSINLGGVTLAGGSFSIDVEWTEE